MADKSCFIGTFPGQHQGKESGIDLFFIINSRLVLKFGVAEMPHSSESSRREMVCRANPWGTRGSSPSVLEEGEGKLPGRVGRLGEDMLRWWRPCEPQARSSPRLGQAPVLAADIPSAAVNLSVFFHHCVQKASSRTKSPRNAAKRRNSRKPRTPPEKDFWAVLSSPTRTPEVHQLRCLTKDPNSAVLTHDTSHLMKRG